MTHIHTHILIREVTAPFANSEMQDRKFLSNSYFFYEESFRVSLTYIKAGKIDSLDQCYPHSFQPPLCPSTPHQRSWYTKGGYWGGESKVFSEKKMNQSPNLVPWDTNLGSSAVWTITVVLIRPHSSRKPRNLLNQLIWGKLGPYTNMCLRWFSSFKWGFILTWSGRHLLTLPQWLGFRK